MRKNSVYFFDIIKIERNGKMARPYGTKNVMRTAEEKEEIILNCINGKTSIKGAAESHNISRRLLITWVGIYREKGIEGLRSKSGRHKNPNLGKYNRCPSEIEKLKSELLKKEIEIARLKKSYQVRGVGAKKEFVTTFEKNTK